MAGKIAFWAAARAAERRARQEISRPTGPVRSGAYGLNDLTFSQLRFWFLPPPELFPVNRMKTLVRRDGFACACAEAVVVVGQTAVGKPFSIRTG